MNKYKITKRGRKIIYSISFLIVFCILNSMFSIVKSSQIVAQHIMKQFVEFAINEKKYYAMSISSHTNIAKSDSSTKEVKITVPLLTNVTTPIPTVAPTLEPTPTIEPTQTPEISKTESDEPSYSVEKAYANDGKKIAFLTFDDGPSATNTEKILEILNSYKIKATFFVIGSNVEKNKDILRAIASNGHAIGNHSYTHDYKVLYSDVEAFDNEVKKTNDAIKNVLGLDFSSRLFRFPGGAFESAPMKPFKNDLKDNGYVYIDWNAINGDGEENNISPERLISRAKDTVGNQQHVVLLMHDAPIKYTTVEALPQIIDYLIEKGYTFATLK